MIISSFGAASPECFKIKGLRNDPKQHGGPNIAQGLQVLPQDSTSQVLRQPSDNSTLRAIV
jgi:hypothetical protein